MPTNVKTKLLKAIEIHQNGNSEEAQSIYEQVISSHPDLDQPWYLYGLMSMEAYDFGKALECFSKAMALSPANLAYTLAVGQAHYAMENWEHALEFSNTVLITQGATLANMQESALLKGQSLEKLDRLEEAESYLRNYMEASPNVPEVHIALACVFFKQKKYEWAHAALDTALQANPKHLKALIQRGDFYCLRGKFHDAEKAYWKALEAHKADPQPHTNLGKLFKQRGNLAWAKSAYQTALKHSKCFYPAHRELADLFLKQDDATHALKHFKEMKRLRPQNLVTLSMMLQTGLRALDFDWVKSHWGDVRTFEISDYESCINYLEGYFNESKDAMIRAIGMAITCDFSHG